MLFTSAEYLLAFLPVSVVVYFWLTGARRTTAARAWLVLASLFFYGWWNPAYVPLLLLSMAGNWLVGARLAGAPGTQRPLLIAGVTANLALLGYYKYAGFLVANAAGLLGTNWSPPAVLLPLAISFFTFTQIAYLVDCHRGLVRDRDPLNYALFVVFFPHLIAGPVVHHADLMPQFAARRNLAARYPNIVRGLFIFAAGLFKKLVLADTFAAWATAGFDHAPSLDFLAAWVTSLSYTFQIYFDFSGYSDMAIGASLLFNIRLPRNFASPYRATSIREFWRRWHITLSRFLRDYLYIPLGGNRRGAARGYANVVVTFVLGGLWHGASWMFVIWGALHGAALAIHRGWQAGGGRLPMPVAWLLTFLFVNVTWVFFRARDLPAAWKVLRPMTGIDGIGGSGCAAQLLGKPAAVATACLQHVGGNAWTLAALAAALAIVALLPNTNRLFLDSRTPALLRPWLAAALGTATAAVFVFSLASPYSEFIYFNF